jgi:hypothetical protein
MPMRDLQRLEELSSTAALGLWADDVVLALHRATASDTPSEADQRLLTNAASTLIATQTRADQPLSTPSSARDLAATDTALNVVATFAQEHALSDEDRALEVRELLSSMAKVLHDAAEGRLAGAEEQQLEPALSFFGTVGEVQLVESNSVLASRKDPGPWTATRMISNSS